MAEGEQKEARVLNGKEIAADVRKQAAAELAQLKAEHPGFVPGLTIVQVCVCVCVVSSPDLFRAKRKYSLVDRVFLVGSGGMRGMYARNVRDEHAYVARAARTTRTYYPGA